MKSTLTFIILLVSFSTLFAQWNFNTSLHKTRTGFNYGYSKENGGMEKITDIPFSQLKCRGCHSVTGLYANGTVINPNTYSPVCVDCHYFQTTVSVTDETCFSCHLKQKLERDLYPGVDVHSNADMTCISCHSKEELHGDDGILYSSMKETGAVKVKCINCHTNLSNNSSHNRHLAAVDCAACHAVSVYSCGGCHFETYAGTGNQRYNNEFFNYRLLVKNDGLIKLGSISTHSFNNKTNFTISSTHSHIIKKIATTCSDCHRAMGSTNIAIKEYNDTGFITVVKWDTASKKAFVTNAVIPVPADWKTSLKIDHVTYAGDSSVFPSNPDLWEYLKSETDNAHMYFAEPLDSSTLQKLGFTRFPTSVEIEENIPSEFTLYQNYPNPFNPATLISYQLPVSGYVTLKIYDLLGREVAVLVDEYKPAGKYEVEFQSASRTGRLASGIYYYQLKTGDYIHTKKMMLMQ